MQFVGNRPITLVGSRRPGRPWRSRRLRRPRWLLRLPQPAPRSLAATGFSRRRTWRRRRGRFERLSYCWLTRPRRRSLPPWRPRSVPAPWDATSSAAAGEDPQGVSIAPYFSQFTMLQHSPRHCEPHAP